jgi:hypothetical protein
LAIVRCRTTGEIKLNAVLLYAWYQPKAQDSLYLGE